MTSWGRTMPTRSGSGPCGEKRVYISGCFPWVSQASPLRDCRQERERFLPWILRSTIDTRIFNGLVESVRVGITGEAYLTTRPACMKRRLHEENIRSAQVKRIISHPMAVFGESPDDGMDR